MQTRGALRKNSHDNRHEGHDKAATATQEILIALASEGNGGKADQADEAHGRRTHRTTQLTAPSSMQEKVPEVLLQLQLNIRLVAKDGIPR